MNRDEIADAIYGALEEGGWSNSLGLYPYEVADAVLPLLAEAWDKGFADGVNHDIGDWENAPSIINNPYRQEQTNE